MTTTYIYAPVNGAIYNIDAVPYPSSDHYACYGPSARVLLDIGSSTGSNVGLFVDSTVIKSVRYTWGNWCCSGCGGCPAGQKRAVRVQLYSAYGSSSNQIGWVLFGHLGGVYISNGQTEDILLGPGPVFVRNVGYTSTDPLVSDACYSGYHLHMEGAGLNGWTFDAALVDYYADRSADRIYRWYK